MSDTEATYTSTDPNVVTVTPNGRLFAMGLGSATVSAKYGTTTTTALVNVTNDAWYGRSFAAEQHEQIAAMRAIETARPMLRSTNTGITSIIDHHGKELARLPWFTRGLLEGAIAGRTGTTPYVRSGDALAVFASLLLAGAAFVLRRRRSTGPD